MNYNMKRSPTNWICLLEFLFCFYSFADCGLLQALQPPHLQVLRRPRYDTVHLSTCFPFFSLHPGLSQ